MKKNKVSAFTFRSVVDDIARKYGDNVAFSVYGKSGSDITYNELKASVDRMSVSLIANGIGKGDKIAILSDNSPNWMIAYFAIASIGAIAVPMLVDFSEKEVGNMLAHSECKGIVTNSRNYAKVIGFVRTSGIMLIRCEDLFLLDGIAVSSISSRDDFSACKGIAMMESGNLKSQEASDALKLYEPSEDDVVSLIYTSGTTGSPKGVMLTHMNLVHNADEACVAYVDIFPGDRALSILPLSHAYEFTESQLVPLLCGATIYFLSGPPAVSVLMKALRDIRPHILNTVPVFIEKIYRKMIQPKLEGKGVVRALANFRLTRKFVLRKICKKLVDALGGNMKFFGIGGAPLDAKIEQFIFEVGFPYALGYGLTETSPLVSACGPKTGRRIGCIGKTVESDDVILLNPDPNTGIGEIAVKGPNVMKGYYKNEEATREAFTEDGYFKTGDLGCFDKDGWLGIKGRIKTMILGPSGENIYPENIESLLNSQDFVDESLVVPSGSGLVALIRLNLEEFAKSLPGRISDMNSEIQKYLAKLVSSVNSQLGRASRIGSARLQKDPFVRTPTQKIRRFLYSDGKSVLMAETVSACDEKAPDTPMVPCHDEGKLKHA